MNPHGGQDWLGFAVVIAVVLVAVGLDYLLASVLLLRDARANRRALQSVRKIAAARCPECGCQVLAGHVPDSGECRELQGERLARSMERAREWFV